MTCYNHKILPVFYFSRLNMSAKYIKIENIYGATNNNRKKQWQQKTLVMYIFDPPPKKKSNFIFWYIDWFFFYINFFPNTNLEYMITFWELLLFVKLKSIFKGKKFFRMPNYDPKVPVWRKISIVIFCHCCHCHIVVTKFVIVSIVITVALIWFLSESLELENRKYLVI